MNLQIMRKGNPSAFWYEKCPTNDEIEECVRESGDYESAADSVFFQREPNEYDGDTRAVLKNVRAGEIVYHSYETGKCYSQNGEELSDEYIEASHAAGIPEGDASNPESLKTLIANVEPLIGSPENVTLISKDEEVDDE